MNQELLAELKILFALGELSASEQAIVQRYLDPAEQTELLDTINSLAYSAPAIAPSPNLKAKIWQKIAAESTGLQVRRYQDLEWEPHPVVQGIALALLHLDPSQRQTAYLVQCQPNVQYPAHQHHGTELLLILDGHILVDDQVYGKGDCLVSLPNSIHAPLAPDGCLFYVQTSLDDRFVQWTPSMVWQFIKHSFRKIL